MAQTSSNSHKIKWQFLSDDPVKTDSFGIHTTYARLLANVALSCRTPFTIGLYSSWGTGKTTIAQLLEQILASSGNATYVYLDVWKYSSDPLKRWILLETHRQLEQAGLIKDYRFNGRTLQSYLEFEEEWEQKEKLHLNLSGLSRLATIAGYGIAGALVMLGLTFWLIPTGAIQAATSSALGFLLGGGISALLSNSVVKSVLEKLRDVVVEQKTRHVRAKAAFSSESFSRIFSDLIATASSSRTDSRLLFVFDNLDRCSAEVAIEAIGVIKTYLGEPNCIYLLPCDEKALVKHLSSLSQDPSEGTQQAREFLDKFFQVTIRLPITPDVDFDAYLEEQLKQAAMSDLPIDAREVLLVGYRTKTPRQIKRILNDLIGFRALAEQAEYSEVIGEGTLTGSLALLTKMAVISARWPDFLVTLAKDPEIWTEIAQAHVSGKRYQAEPVDLEEFLWATRFISPETDIRPFLYLKTISYEKDQKLTHDVEGFLTQGQSEPLLSLFENSQYAAKAQEIIQICVRLSKRWLGNKRILSVQNAAAVLMALSRKFPEDQQIEKTVFDLLEFVATSKPPEELATVVRVQDVLSCYAKNCFQQKQLVLGHFAKIMAAGSPNLPNRQEILLALIDSSEQLSPSIKSALCRALSTRFTQAGDAEVEVYRLLEHAAKTSESTSWLPDSSLLETIVGKTTFAGDDPDSARLRILVGFQQKLNSDSRKALVTKLASITSGSRTRAIDASNKNAINFFLYSIPSDFFSGIDVAELSKSLIEQFEANPLAEKAIWLKGLLSIYSSLKEDVRNRVLTLCQNWLSTPNDPQGIAKFLSGLDFMRYSSQLLTFDVIRAAFRQQASYIESNFGSQKTAIRSQILDAIPPTLLLKYPDMLDSERPWDLTQYVRRALVAFEKSPETGQQITSMLRAFYEEHVATKLPKNSEVHASFLDALRAAPALLKPLAEELAQSTVTLFDTELDNNFVRFHELLSGLPLSSKRLLISQIENAYLQPRVPIWKQLLSKLVDVFESDSTLGEDPSMTRELMDYCFDGVREDAGLAPSLLKMAPRLPNEQRPAYLDRSIELLLSFELNGVGLDRMAPFLTLMKVLATDPTPSDVAQLRKFASRMLAPASGRAEKVRVLQLLEELRWPGVNETIPELVELLNSDADQEIKDMAASLLPGDVIETTKKPPAGDERHPGDTTDSETK